jgi:DNA-binding IclR family transcriptional regulator
MSAPEANTPPELLAPTANMLLRGLAVLERVALSPNSRGVAVSGIAAETGLDKSTTSRIMAFLRDAGYLRQDAYRRYRLTSKLSQLAAGYSGVEDIRVVAHPFVQQLHDAYDEEIHLAVIDGGDTIFIDYIGSSRLVRSNLSTTPRPVLETAAGRAILAAMSEDDKNTVLQLTAASTGKTLKSRERAALDRDLETARELGWAGYDAGDDVTRFAAPIMGSDGAPVASMCISGPTYRVLERSQEYSRAVVEAAAAASEALGHVA